MDCVVKHDTLFASASCRVIETEWRSRSGRDCTMIETRGARVSFIQQGHFRFENGPNTLEYHTQTIQHHNQGEVYRARHPVTLHHRSLTVEMTPCLMSEIHAHYWRSGVYPRTSGCVEMLPFPTPLSPSLPATDYYHRRLHSLTRRRAQENISLRVESLALELIACVFAQMYQSSYRVTCLSEQQARRHLERVEAAKAYIHQRFAQPLTLAEIAAVAYLSEYHFLRLFRRLTGVTPHQYLLEVRLQHARTLLLHTRQTVTEVGLESGFGSLAHFTDTFTRRFGVSPSQARRGSSLSVSRGSNRKPQAHAP